MPQAETHSAAADAPLCDTALVAAFDLLGKRWNGIILGVLAGGPLGFADLRRGIGSITDSDSITVNSPAHRRQGRCHHC